MKNNSIVKIILILFFTIFFGFLFYFFYESDSEKINTEETTGFFDDLFPFGDNNDLEDDDDSEKTEEKEKDSNQKTRENISKLRQISDIPTVSAHIELLSKLEVFDINKKRKSFEKLEDGMFFSDIRFIAIKNNHIYQTFDFTKEKKRISNITIPKITQANFFDKNNFIIRYKNEFDKLKTYTVTLSNNTDKNVIEGSNDFSTDIYLKKFQGVFFPDDIENLFINKKENLVFYTTFKDTGKNIDGKIHGIISTKNSKEKKEIFSSVLKEWNFSFNNKNKILLTTKNSGTAKSISFSLGVKNGSFKKISKSRIGLNAVSNYDFSKILYSQKNNLNTYVLIIDDLKTKKQKEFNISTFVEKCVWSQNNIDFYCAIPRNISGNNQPDDWYKGKNYFRDDILKINSESGLIEVIFDSRSNSSNHWREKRRQD